MRGRERVGDILERRDRDAGAIRERRQGARCLLVQDATTHDEDGALGAGEQFHRAVELPGITGRQHRVAVGGRGDRLGRDLLEQDFARSLDVRRTLRLRERDAKGLPHRFLHLLHGGDAVGPLGDRAHEGHLVHVLGGVALAHRAHLHAAYADHRDEAAVSSTDRGDEVGDARGLGGGDDGGAARSAREAVGHEGGALLVAREDEADLRRVAQGVDHRQVLRAGDAEDVVDALAQERVHQRPRAGHRCRAIGVRCFSERARAAVPALILEVHGGSAPGCDRDASAYDRSWSIVRLGPPAVFGHASIPTGRR